MKLSKKDIVQRRVDLMTAEGIKFITNTQIGQDKSASELYDSNDAVVLAMGATRPRDLPIPNRSATGIHFAMEFLQTWQQKQWGDKVDHEKISAKDLDVIVIGGNQRISRQIAIFINFPSNFEFIKILCQIEYYDFPSN